MTGCLVYWQAQQKAVPDEKFADPVSGEVGAGVGSNPTSISLLPYKNIRDGQTSQLERVFSSVSWQRRKVLCASIELILGVFLYGRLLWCGHVVTVSNRDCDSLSLGSNPCAPTICKHIRDKQELVATRSPRLVCLHMVSINT